MALMCRNCSRANPPDARYCYNDGAALDGAIGGRGPIAIGAQPFGNAFVFPSGRACRNFDELALACDTDWDSARDLLKQGFLERFLGGMGRVDLAMAARQAAASPDLDRAMDSFLGKLPASTRDGARLVAAPLDVNLGVLSRDTDRTFQLTLENQGMGLLYGSVTASNTPWLTIGEGTGTPNKLFQCRRDQTLTVHVLGKFLRAANKPIDGKLVIDSNGGTLTVVVKAEVPVKPYPDGVLAGARSPRELALKAKVAPKEAALLFEKGGVQTWYDNNGWTYPVQGPASRGVAAVQQFFEALGLVSPPKVDISERKVQLYGPPGAALDYELQIRASEKRPVFAHATSSSPWLQIGKIVLSGNSARIPLKVSVPHLPGEQLNGNVNVTSNGNQRFSVEVALNVAAGPGGVPPRRPPSMGNSWNGGGHAEVVPEMEPVFDLVPNPVGQTVKTSRGTVPLLEVYAAAAAAPPVPNRQPALPPMPASPPMNAPPPPSPVYPAQQAAIHPAQQTMPMGAIAPMPMVQPMPRGHEPVAAVPAESPGILKHFLMPLVLLLALLVALVHDFLVKAPGPDSVSGGTDEIDPNPVLAVQFSDASVPVSPKPKMKSTDSMRFGLTMLLDSNGKPVTKRLTFDTWGRTNNACVKIDGEELIFGEPNILDRDTAPRATWVVSDGPLPEEPGMTYPYKRQGKQSVWKVNKYQVYVTQTVEIVPGEQSRKLDTLLVRYSLENRDSVPHQVGIRFMLDTFIGTNDGVPFTIPGKPGLCNTKEKFAFPGDVPDYIEAMENEDLRNPGTVARIQFRIGKQIESPTQVFLGGWPHSGMRAVLGRNGALDQNTLWSVPEESMRALHESQATIAGTKEKPPLDSAVTMYWDPKQLDPGGRREVGFAYGLGSVSGDGGSGHLLVSTGGNMVSGGAFTLNALVSNPIADEQLELELPDGFQLLDGGSLKQPVPAAQDVAGRRQSSVTWRIRAGREGPFTIVVKSTNGTKVSIKGQIKRPAGVFD